MLIKATGSHSLSLLSSMLTELFYGEACGMKKVITGEITGMKTRNGGKPLKNLLPKENNPGEMMFERVIK